MGELVIRSGATIRRPEELIQEFFEEVWTYYDGNDDAAPDEIRPVDVVATLLSTCVHVSDAHPPEA